MLSFMKAYRLLGIVLGICTTLMFIFYWFRPFQYSYEQKMYWLSLPMSAIMYSLAYFTHTEIMLKSGYSDRYWMPKQANATVYLILSFTYFIITGLFL